MTMITPSYLGETIEYSSLHACRSTLEDPTDGSCRTSSTKNTPSGVGVEGFPTTTGIVRTPWPYW